MSSLKDKMYNYEVTPPANTWEKVRFALNEYVETNAFSEKLQNLEVIPPSGVWEKINSTLDAEQIIPARRIRRIAPLLRYAAAAVIVIGLTTFGIIKFTYRTSGDKEVVTNGTNNSSIESHTQTQDQNTFQESSTTISEQERDDAALEESKKTFARLDISDNNKQKIRAALMMKPVDLISSDNADRNYPEVCFPDNLRVILANSPTVNTAERYIMLMTPDGNIIRMSKKWSDLLCCVSGEDEDEGCKDQLKKWREKIANAPVAPSPGNFMDILGLIQSLHDNTP